MSTRNRKILIVTGSRAEYGLLYWVIRKIHENPDLELQLIVTGTHLSPKFGLTIKEIESDGFPIRGRVKIPLSSDSSKAISIAMGHAIIGFASIYARLRPDIIVVLGDRFEIHAAVSAAIPFGIPIAHIHGGELTEGVFDEQLRHSITKMSHIHFASTKVYRKRIIQMGERPKYVFCFGSPAIDNILGTKLLERKDLYKNLGIPEGKKIGICTYHPTSLGLSSKGSEIGGLLDSIRETKELWWVFTACNADTGNRAIIKEIKNFVKKNHKICKFYMSLGRRRYLSLLKNTSLMIGNSSSGIIEAPSFKLPVINIGDRQKGRIRAKNVIDIKKCEKKLVSNAIKRAVSPKFKDSIKRVRNPYGSGKSSKKIVNTLKRISIDEKLIKKEFYET
ncbi:MAG: UDP-N-acetylglucosamine 2-epimerase (hydrolyzing) [Candidatus Omnitrophica bacterium]|nr:UDP-N-acetylglucosamine 2-epimerase (hydrolyzing) [Candidatus Omnitrophota bacterium]